MPADQVLALASALIGTGVHEARAVAVEMVSKRRLPLDRAALERLGRGLGNWTSVDPGEAAGLRRRVCPKGGDLTGAAWLRGHVTEADVAAWAASPDRWWRRLALVSTTTLNRKSRGGPGNAPRTLAVCAMLAADPDPMVVKALSWALRELAPRAPDAVAVFLDAHPELPALVRREVRRKLETSRRN